MPSPRKSSRLARGVRYGGYFGLYAICGVGLFLQWGQITSYHLAIGGISYLVRMFALVGVNHRYFAHRSYEMGRGAQFLMALLGCLAVQKGPLWWSYNHELHHRFSDTPRDPHSPWRQGLWMAHVHWLLDDRTWFTDPRKVPARFRKFPELAWLDRNELLVIVLFAASVYLLLGPWAFLWGYCISTVLIWQGIHAIGIFGHRFGGYRRYATAENSRNRWLIGLLTLGEGFHNNHHECPSSARIGFFWYEVDLAYYVLKLLERLGVVHHVRVVPDRIKHQRGRGFQRRLDMLQHRLSSLEPRLMESTGDFARRHPGSGDELERFKAAATPHLSAFTSRGAELLRLGPARFSEELEALRGNLARHTASMPPEHAGALLTSLNLELDRFHASCKVSLERSP